MTPDRWVVLKIEEGLYKVLAGWGGSYLHGDSWKINSGIAEVKQDGDCYEFYGYSGSCYRCHKENYGFNMASMGIYKKLLEVHPVQLLDENTNWMEIV